MYVWVRFWSVNWKVWSIDYKYILQLHNHLLDDNRIMKMYIYVNCNIHDMSVINLSVRGFVLFVYRHSFIWKSRLFLCLLFNIISSVTKSTLSTFQVNHLLKEVSCHANIYIFFFIRRAIIISLLFYVLFFFLSAGTYIC